MLRKVSEWRHSRPVPAFGGFTLIELLVVVAIIAVLIAILIPALGRSRAQARTTACKANLRSMGQLLYIYDNSFGSLPIGWGSDPNQSGAILDWYISLQGTASSESGMNTYSSDGISKIRRMFIDPDAPGADVALHANNYNGNQTLALIQYNCHPVLMPALAGPLGANPIPYKLSQIQRGDLVMVMDAVLTGYPGDVWRTRADVAVASLIDNGAIYGTGQLIAPNSSKPLSGSIDMANGQGYTPNTDTTNTSLYCENIHFRHLDNTHANVVMCDGHVESFVCNNGILASNPSAPNVTDFLRRYLVVNP